MVGGGGFTGRLEDKNGKEADWVTLDTFWFGF